MVSISGLEAPAAEMMRTTAPCSHESAIALGDDDAVAKVTRLTEALRRARRGSAPAEAELHAAAERVAETIREHLPRGIVKVTLTGNRYTMISVRRTLRGHGPKAYDVRLHCMFVDPDVVIARALAQYIVDNDRDASRVLGDFIDANAEAVRNRGRRSAQPVLLTTGDHHDLRAIYDQLNQRYFDGAIDAAITWGARLGPARRRTSIKMGSYSVEDRLIRLHRSLDRAFVPAVFVEWIVFHEMLHQVHDIKVKNGRREFHSRAFLTAEASFDGFLEARAWERANLDALLTY
jgi:hypothetical protein